MNAKKLIIEKKIESTEVSPEAYKSTPWWYDLRGFFILTFAYRDTLWSQMKFFNQNIGNVHLEGAIGTGTLSYFILLYRRFSNQKNNFTFYGVDYSPEMLSGAKNKIKGENLNIEFGDLTQLKYECNFFNTINIANSFHTIKDIHLAIKEVQRVLKHDGQFSLNVLIYPSGTSILDKLSNSINKWGQKKGILYRPYEPSEVVKMLEQENFRITFRKIQGNALYLRCKKAQ